MTKTLLSILIALIFVFGAAGVTVAAAQQSQPGEALYTLRTWSAQILLQQDKTQIQGGQMGKMIQTRSGMHEQESFQTPQGPAPFLPCDQSGTTAQCGSDQGAGLDHANEHHQDHNGTDHGNNGTNGEHDGTGHGNDGSDHD